MFYFNSGSWHIRIYNFYMKCLAVSCCTSCFGVAIYDMLHMFHSRKLWAAAPKHCRLCCYLRASVDSQEWENRW